MKHKLLSLAAATAAVFLAGCDTSGVQSRIQEKATIYNQLAEWQKRDIQDGVVSIGSSTDMVYMALGKPSKIVASANGNETTWTYNNYYPPSVRAQAQMSLNTTSSVNNTGPVENANSPRNTRSLSDTSTRGTTQTNLDVPDLPSDTLFVIFRDGQVYETKLASENR